MMYFAVWKRRYNKKENRYIRKKEKKKRKIIERNKK